MFVERIELRLRKGDRRKLERLYKKDNRGRPKAERLPSLSAWVRVQLGLKS